MPPSFSAARIDTGRVAEDESVVKAVRRAVRILNKNENGFILVARKRIAGSTKSACRPRPSVTVAMYLLRGPTSDAIPMRPMVQVTRKNIPIGARYKIQEIASMHTAKRELNKERRGEPTSPTNMRVVPSIMLTDMTDKRSPFTAAANGFVGIRC